MQVELDCVRVASWRCCVFLLKRKNHSPQAQSTAAQEVMHHMLWERRKPRTIDEGLKKQFAGSKAQIKVLKLLCFFSAEERSHYRSPQGAMTGTRLSARHSRSPTVCTYLYSENPKTHCITDQMNLLKSERKETKLSVHH